MLVVFLGMKRAASDTSSCTRSSVAQPDNCFLLNRICFNQFLYILAFLVSEFNSDRSLLFSILCQTCKMMDQKRSHMSKLFSFYVKDVRKLQRNLQGLFAHRIFIGSEQKLTLDDIGLLSKMSLKKLSLHSAPAYLFSLTSLRVLHCFKKIECDLPPNLEKFDGHMDINLVSVNSSLTCLSLRRCFQDLDYFDVMQTKFPNLTNLGLYFCLLRTPQSLLFSRLNLLKFSIVSPTDMICPTDAFVRQLAPTVRPNKLWLDDIFDIGLISRFANVKKLSLREMSKATSVDVLNSLHFLETLVLQRCGELTNIALRIPTLQSAQFWRLPKLKSVDLRNNTSLTSLKLAVLYVLQSVRLQNCPLLASNLQVELCPCICFL
jgi:hypothetical protein